MYRIWHCWSYGFLQPMNWCCLWKINHKDWSPYCFPASVLDDKIFWCGCLKYENFTRKDVWLFFLFFFGNTGLIIIIIIIWNTMAEYHKILLLFLFSSLHGALPFVCWYLLGLLERPLGGGTKSFGSHLYTVLKNIYKKRKIVWSRISNHISIFVSCAYQGCKYYNSFSTIPQLLCFMLIK